MGKTTSEKIEIIKNQEKDFRSIIRHLRRECDIYLKGTMTQRLLIILVDIDVIKMKCQSDKVLKDLWEAVLGDARTHYEQNSQDNQSTGGLQD